MWRKLYREKLVVLLSCITVVSLLTMIGCRTERNTHEQALVYLQDYSNSIVDTEAGSEEFFPFLHNRDLSSVQKLVFNRVPKCASTLTRHLFKGLSKANDFEFIFVLSNEKKNFNQTSQRRVISRTKDVKRPWMYIQHFHMFNFTDHGQEMPVYINIVREPLQRLVSSYYFNRYALHMPMPAKDFSMSFEQCVVSRHYDCTNPSHVFQVIPYFCGSLPECTKPSDWALARAKQNVMKYYSAIGYMEELTKFYFVLETSMPQFFRGLQKVYEEQGSAYKQKHSTRTRVGAGGAGGDTVLTNASSQYMKTLLARDYDFYYFIRQRFHVTYMYYYNKAYIKT